MPARQTVVEALTAERDGAKQAITDAEVALKSATIRGTEALKEATRQQENVAKAEADIARTRDALDTADPVDIDALRDALTTAEEAFTSARAALLAQQELTRRAAADKAIVQQQLARARTRLADMQKRLDDATAEAKLRAALVLLLVSPAVAGNAASLALVQAKLATVTAALTTLLTTEVYDAMHKRRALENLRRQTAQRLNDYARLSLDLAAPLRVGESATLSAPLGEYERTRARASQFAAQVDPQLQQAQAFLDLPLPAISPAAKQDLVDRSKDTDNKKAVAAESKFLDVEISVEDKRRELVEKKFDKWITPTVSITAKQNAYDTEVTKRDALVTPALMTQLELMRQWRTAMPAELKKYLQQLEDVTDTISRIAQGFADNFATQLTTTNADLAAAIKDDGKLCRRLELIDDEALACGIRKLAAEEQFAVLAQAAARGESADPIALP